MTNSTANNNRTFSGILDKFCGYNYHNPYWILLALYLRKENKLSVEEDYKGANVNKLSSDLTKVSLADDIWKENTDYLFEGTTALTLTVIGKIEGNSCLQEIVDIFRKNKNTTKESVEPGLATLVEWSKEDAASAMLIETARALLALDSQWFEENFLTLFDQALRRIFALMNLEEHFQPKEVTNLASSILGRVQGRVYNPFAGIGSYGVTLRNWIDDYLGEEINPIVSAIGNLRLMSSYVNGEILTSRALIERPSCDAAISTPPFGVRVPYEESYNQGTNDYETLTLRKFANMFIRSVTVVTDHVCTGGGFCRLLRKDLLEMGCVDMIVSLPAGIFNTTGVKTSIVVLDPYHRHKESVKFVDATSCFTTEENKRKLDVSSAIALLNNPSSVSVKAVSYSEIIARDYSFNPRNYLDYQVDTPDGCQLMALGDLGDFVRERSSELEAQGKFATFQSLVTTNRLKVFTPEDFTEKELPRHCMKITQDCVMMSGARGIRGVFVRPEGETLYCHSSYVSFIPKADNVLPLYIVSQLNQPYVLRQVESLASGNTGSNLTLDALRHIKIAIPILSNQEIDLAQQENAIHDYQDSLIKELGMEVEALRIKRFEEYQKDMRMRKHRIGQRLNEIIPSSNVLADFIASQNGDFNKSAIVSAYSQTDLEAYARKLHEDIVSLADLISHFTDEKSFGEPENINIIQFAEAYKVFHKNDRYEIAVMPPKCDQDENGDANQINSLIAYIAKEDLLTVFENLCTNASKYGFINPERKDYAIRITISNTVIDDTPMVRLVIDNNGAHLPKGMSAKKMFTWGVGKGTGIGTWQARHIIEHFGGNITFHQKESDDGFNVGFEIVLPLVVE